MISNQDNKKISIRFKPTLNEKQRQEIIQDSNKIISENKQKRMRNVDKQIWDRESTDPVFQEVNINTNMPRRTMLSQVQIHPFYKNEKKSSNRLNNPDEQKNRFLSTMETTSNFLRTSLMVKNELHTKKEKNTDFLALNCFKKEQIQLLNKAVSIANQKKHSQIETEKEHKDSINTAVAKSEEIYMIDLTTKMINEEIKKLKEMEVQQINEMKKVEKDKKLEHLKFRENFEIEKKLTETVLEKSTTITWKKQQLTKEIKLKGQIQSELKHETKKLEETVLYYSDLKRFLNEISPEFYKDKKSQVMFD